jgi:hypothetical protein
LLLQGLLVPLFGVDPNTSPFVMVAAWFGGLGPGSWSSIPRFWSYSPVARSCC